MNSRIPDSSLFPGEAPESGCIQNKQALKDPSPCPFIRLLTRGQNPAIRITEKMRKEEGHE